MVRRRNLLRVAEGRVAEVKARLARAEAEFALVDPQNGGPTLRIEEAAVAQAKAALVFAEAELDQRTVRAPSDGTVLAVNIRPGEFAAIGGSPPPILLGRLDPLHVRVDIDEADVPRFASGAEAVGLPRGAPERRIALRYVRAEPLVKPKRTLSGLSSDRVDTRVLQVVYSVNPPVDGLRPGQVIDVFIEVASGHSPVAPVRR
jgi:multidrug efflux pump subunit AcrA (membrane-fusion protein)